ncbi:hypothetical protein BGZ96_011406 [Linnemannia gamsii]|uniref:Zeta toxin domain-containing protein n=1 Tax=Linnemannia gamsii TaxID=64522 RepID=A0ABQ7KGR9_9FUNG|nr:hypothetical protein BGZ96_011406 [Linnemannia gamsii]
MPQQPINVPTAQMREEVLGYLEEYKRSVEWHQWLKEPIEIRKAYQQAEALLDHIRYQNFFTQAEIDQMLAEVYSEFSLFERNQGEGEEADRLARKAMGLSEQNRGYERMKVKLNALGASVSRVSGNARANAEGAYGSQKLEKATNKTECSEGAMNTVGLAQSYMRIVTTWLIAWSFLGCAQIVPMPEVIAQDIQTQRDLPQTEITVLPGVMSHTSMLTAHRNRNGVKLENIPYFNFDAPDRHQVQEDAIRAAKAAPEKFINAYRNDARSFEGRYVNSDLFKEIFAVYAASWESRRRYHNPIHRTAAALATALFVENLQTPRESERTTVYFLTGSPGSGKTSMVLKTAELPKDVVMLFEGQMANFDVSRDKIQKVLDAGYQPKIIVVHARVEDAFDKTVQRFNEIGRGSSIHTISSIVGGLPDSLQQLHNLFGPSLSLDIVDVRDRANPVQWQGFENIDILRSEGNYDSIKQRLQARVRQQREAGKISEGTCRQALSLPPRDCLSLDSARYGKHQGECVKLGANVIN